MNVKSLIIKEKPNEIAKRLASELEYGNEVKVENNRLSFDAHDHNYQISLDSGKVYENGRKICVICEREDLPPADQAIAKALTIIHKPQNIHTLGSSQKINHYGPGNTIRTEELIRQLQAEGRDVTEVTHISTINSYSGIISSDSETRIEGGQATTILNGGPGSLFFAVSTQPSEPSVNETRLNPGQTFRWGGTRQPTSDLLYAHQSGY